MSARTLLSRAAALGLLLASVGPARAIDTSIRSYIAENVDDFTATVTVLSANQRELGKISKDAGFLYRFHDIDMRYKEPNKVRMEASTGDGLKGVFVINGPTQWVSVPKLHIKTKRNYGESPGKRKSLMDVGLISDYYLTYTNARFLREGTVDGVPCAVFDMTYKARDEDTSHHIVYVDPKTRVVRRREAYSQTGKLQAIYLFKDIKEVKPGVWFPTVVEAKNTDNRVAGVLGYKDIRVNTGIPDSVFQL